MTHPAPNSEREMLGSSADADTHRAAETPAVAVPETVIRFLLGEGELYGLAFGDDVRSGGRRTPFWWRKTLRVYLDRAMTTTAAPSDAVGMEREARNGQKPFCEKHQQGVIHCASCDHEQAYGPSPKPDVAGARERLEAMRECLDSIIIFARDSLDNGHLFGGDVGNVMGIRDAALKLGESLGVMERASAARARQGGPDHG